MAPKVPARRKPKAQCWTRKKQHGVKKKTHGERVLGRKYTGSAHDDCLLMLMCGSGGLKPKDARRVIRQGGGGSGNWLRGTEAWGDDA